MEFLCWDVPPHETSPTARSKEKRLFSQATYTTQMFKISITWFCVLDASATAAVSITQSPWIWPSNNSWNAIRQHDARLPSTTTATTKIQSLQTSSPTARLVTHAVPCTTTAITYAGTICHGSTITYGTSTCRTVTNATTTSCVMWYKALKIVTRCITYKIILQILWHILWSVIASSKLEKEFHVVTRTHDMCHSKWHWMTVLPKNAKVGKTANIFCNVTKQFPWEMMSLKWVQKLCTDDVSQGTWSGECFWFISPSVWMKIIVSSLLSQSSSCGEIIGGMAKCPLFLHATYE